jgi:hypothetical protein
MRQDDAGHRLQTVVRKVNVVSTELKCCTNVVKLGRMSRSKEQRECER